VLAFGGPLMLPPDVEAYSLMRAKRFAEALPFAERAVAGSSVCLPAHGMLATILLQLGRTSDAESVVCGALQCRPGVADAYDALAHVSMLLGQHERSNALYRQAVERAPGEARFWYNLASSERSFGRLVEAEFACDRAIALDPTQYASYLLRSELRLQSPDANHIGQLQSRLSRPNLPERARVILGYALAKELDDLRRFDEAFHWFAEAASARRRQLAYDVTVDERKLKQIAEAFPKVPQRYESEGTDSTQFIFIIGLPRSGTTLLEHILSGLPRVRSNGETDNFSRSLLAAAPAGPDNIFARAAAADPHAVAEHYARLASSGATQHKIVEKMPMNYLYLGAIRRALPRSSVVLVRRQPLDSCFAMYRTLFGAAYPFSYAFDDLARYYGAYDRLMQHWRASFGETLHEVEYEKLVEDPQRVGAQVASYCGLSWRAEAVEVHKSASVSLTASAAQVRRPIYGSSSGRWRHYRVHLKPLIQELRRQGVTLPDDT
jgi:tetratricopeptide (TPR) repeat protein